MGRTTEQVKKEFRGKTITHVCPSCGGTGKIGVGKHHEFSEKCFECNGTKKILIQW